MQTISPSLPRHVHKFRQSFLNQFNKCPEAARRSHLGMGKDRNTSDLVRGNAVHGAIETYGFAWQEGYEAELEEILQWGKEEFANFSSEDNIEWRQPFEKTEAQVQKNIEVWHEEVLPLLRKPISIEEKFNLLFYEDDQRQIYLTGTPDWVQLSEDGQVEIVDWKNPKAEPRDLWIEDRSNLQAAVYSWALSAESFTLYWLHWNQSKYRDTGKDKPNYTVRRIPRHIENEPALQELVISAAISLEANLPALPQQWDSWFCSPQWCPHWSECRGKHLGEVPFWESKQ